MLVQTEQFKLVEQQAALIDFYLMYAKSLNRNHQKQLYTKAHSKLTFNCFFLFAHNSLNFSK
jgi:hypothetical protein